MPGKAGQTVRSLYKYQRGRPRRAQSRETRAPVFQFRVKALRNSEEHGQRAINRQHRRAVRAADHATNLGTPRAGEPVEHRE